MATVSKIIEGALQDIAVIAQQQSPATTDAALGLERLNSMLGDWYRRGVQTGLTIPLAAADSIDSGLEDSIRLNLALRLAPAFGKATNPELVNQARETFTALNIRSSIPTGALTPETWGWLVGDALQQAGVILEGQNASQAQMNRGKTYLDAMLGDWHRRGIVTGVTLPTDFANDVPASMNDPIRLNLALRLIPAFGESSIPEATKNTLYMEAKETLNALMARSSAVAPAYEDGTWGWLMTDALFQAGVIQEGVLPSLNQVNRAFKYFSRMTDQWMLEGQLAHVPFHVEPFTVTEEKLVYTIGPDSDADITIRSMATIETISIQYFEQNAWESTLRKVDWDTIVRQTRHDLSGTWPSLYYYEAAWPIGCIYFNIKPIQGTIIKVVGKADWLDEGTIDGVITLPEGYEEAVACNLAVRLATAYQKPVSQMLYKMAKDSKKNLRKRNYRGRLSMLPEVLHGYRTGQYYGTLSR